MMKNINNYFFVFYSLLFIGLVFLFVFTNSNSTIDIEQSVFKAYNVLQEPKRGVNYVADQRALYVPDGYEITTVENGVLIESPSIKYSIFYGQGLKENNELLGTLNSQLPLLYEMTPTISNNNTYIGVWEYDVIKDDKYLEAVIVNDDSFIAGVFPTISISKSMEEMAYIFNSIEFLNEENNDSN